MKTKQFVKTFIALALVLLVQQSNAQVKLGLRAGINLSKINTSSEHGLRELQTESLLTYHFGTTLDYRLSDKLSFQPSLLFSVKGSNNDLEYYWDPPIEGYDKFFFSYLDIPLHIAYKINNFQFFAGPYVAFGLSGKNEWNVKGEDFQEAVVLDLKPIFGELDSDDVGKEDGYFKSPDIGLNIGVGYTIDDFLINAGYSLGLSNIRPGIYGTLGSDLVEYNNRVVTFSVGYFFLKK